MREYGRPQVARGRRGGSSRRAVRRVLPLDVSAAGGRRAIPPGRSGSRGPIWKSTTSERCCTNASLAADLAPGLDIAASMQYYWITHGTTEAVGGSTNCLPAAKASAPTMVRAYYLRAWLSMLQGDPAGSAPWITRAVAIARRGRVSRDSVRITLDGGDTSAANGDLAAARRYLDEAEAIAAALNDFPATIELVLSRVDSCGLPRRWRDPHALCSRASASLARPVISSNSKRCSNLGMAGIDAGDLHASNPRFVEALRVARRVDHRLGQYYGGSAAAGMPPGRPGTGRGSVARRGRRAAHADRWRAWRADDPLCRGRAASGTGSVGSSAVQRRLRGRSTHQVERRRCGSLLARQLQARPPMLTTFWRARLPSANSRWRGSWQERAQQPANRCAPLHLRGDGGKSHAAHHGQAFGVNSRSQIAVLMTPRD